MTQTPVISAGRHVRVVLPSKAWADDSRNAGQARMACPALGIS
jgi:hypothetical protein